MTDIANVAKRLSKAQKRAILNAKETIGGDYKIMLYDNGRRVPLSTLRILAATGLWNFITGILTPFGLAVRAYLESSI